MKTETTADIIRSYTEKECRDLCVEYLDIRQKVLAYLFNECKIKAISGCPFDCLINSHLSLKHDFSV